MFSSAEDPAMVYALAGLASLVAALRNAIMNAKSQPEWYAVLDWLYGGSGLD